MSGRTELLKSMVRQRPSLAAVEKEKSARAEFACVVFEIRRCIPLLALKANAAKIGTHSAHLLEEEKDVPCGACTGGM